jgi:hypothetical protein
MLWNATSSGTRSTARCSQDILGGAEELPGSPAVTTPATGACWCVLMPVHPQKRKFLSHQLLSKLRVARSSAFGGWRDPATRKASSAPTSTSRSTRWREASSTHRPLQRWDILISVYGKGTTAHRAHGAMENGRLASVGQVTTSDTALVVGRSAGPRSALPHRRSAPSRPRLRDR